MKNIGILNLTRFGDLIQTSPVTAGLKRCYPDATLHLIVKRRFRGVAEMLPGVDRICEIDGDALATKLGDPAYTFLDGYRETRRIADDLATIDFDVVFNFTHSRASAALLSLLSCTRPVGYSISRDGLRQVHEPWLVHMGTLVRARRLSRLNLVDIYRGAAGLVGADERLAVHVPAAARASARARIPDGSPVVAVQLGASQDAKTWATEHFATALQAAQRRVPGLRFALVGVDAERPRADALRTHAPELAWIDLVGATTIPELAAALERCDLLLTGDTGTMHLAAAVGVPICAVFVGLGTPWETAPYGEGHLAVASRLACAPCDHHVECGFPVCHTDVSPAWVGELLARRLLGESLDDLPTPPRAEVWRTRFDEHGLLDLEPLHARTPDAEDLLAIAYRELFVEQLAGIPTDAERVRARTRARHGSADGWRTIVPEEVPGALQRLRTFAGDAERVARGMRGVRDAAELKRAADRLAEADRDIFAVARSVPLLAPLGISLEGELESLPDTDLDAMVDASADLYATLHRRAGLLNTLLSADPKGVTA